MIVIISIHPPRAGRDAWSAADSARTTNFNPPSPCGEGQNRLSMVLRHNYFNPPSPCGEGQHPL